MYRKIYWLLYFVFVFRNLANPSSPPPHWIVLSTMSFLFISLLVMYLVFLTSPSDALSLVASSFTQAIFIPSHWIFSTLREYSLNTVASFFCSRLSTHFINLNNLSINSLCIGNYSHIQKKIVFLINPKTLFFSFTVLAKTSKTMLTRSCIGG